MGIKYWENTNRVVLKGDEYDKNMLSEVLKDIIKSEKLLYQLHLFPNKKILNICTEGAKI